jgi:hypothetical protein
MNMVEVKDYVTTHKDRVTDSQKLSSLPCPKYPDGKHLYYWNTTLWRKEIKFEQCKCGATGRIESE